MNQNLPVHLEEYLKLHPADLADHLQRLPQEEAVALLQQLPTTTAATVLAEVEKEKLPEFLPVFPAAQLAEICRRLPADEIGRAHV